MKEIDKPKIPRDDWLIMENKAVGICGTDLHIVAGRFPPGGLPRDYFPVVLGHELAGFVAEKGRDVKNVEIGDRVIVDCTYGCVAQGSLPTCRMCLTGYDRLCKNLKHSGIFYPGGYGEYSPEHWTKVFRIPDNVSMEEAGITDCLGTCVHAANMGLPNVGDSVAVLGAGTIGLDLVQVLKSLGVHHIISVAKYSFQAHLARSLGADDVVCIEKGEEPEKRVMEVTDDDGVDVAFDCVGGRSEALQQSIEVIKPRGRIVLVGVYSDRVSIDPLKLLMKEGKIVSIYCFGYLNGRHEHETALRLLSERKVTHKPIVTHKYKIDDWKQAWQVASETSKYSSIKVEWTY